MIVKRYEGLFILNLAGKEEALKDAVDKVSAEITAAGGKIEAVQKMDKKSFVRVANKRNTAGHYVNVVFEAPPAVLTVLQTKFQHVAEVFRVLFHESPKPVAAK
ncbi:MAG: 30S ribosomal protein S6 [Pedosphaera sp.]|nr:30S ribosomal protein S6 [Pedosphaera sp.]